MSKDRISDEDFELIQSLCTKNNFKVDNIGSYIRIHDRRGQDWYIENKNYSNNKSIYLYHGNTRGGAGFHRQGVANRWNGSFDNFYKVLAYIRNHTTKESRSQSRVFYMKELFNSLNLH